MQQQFLVDRDVIDAAVDYWEIMEPVFHAVPLFKGKEHYLRTRETFTLPQRYVLGLSWYETQVGYDGHRQFYTGDAGMVWEDAMAGANAMGLEPLAQIIHQSALRLGEYLNRPQEEMKAFLQDRPDFFADLDQRLYTYNQAGLEDKYLQYIRANKEAFYFQGLVTIEE